MLARALRRRLILAIALVLPQSVQAETLASLVKSRADIALALSRPASRCVVRNDTAAPAFHGCIDWHSAVHGTWALVAYAAMTGDHRYDEIVATNLTPDRLELERQHLVAEPWFEMPYGRSWFLRLAVEYARSHKGDARLDALADEAAASLLRHYDDFPVRPLSKAYDSASWALVNLHDYYSFRGDAAALAKVTQLIRETMVDAPKLRCTEKNERPEFMATCTNIAWAVSKVLDRPAYATWLARFMPPSAAPRPIRPASIHENGLNFSRAWGLWHIAKASGDPAYLRAYVRHVDAAYRDTQSWDGRYEEVAHWVPQFGMLAIQPLFAQPAKAVSVP